MYVGESYLSSSAEVERLVNACCLQVQIAFILNMSKESHGFYMCSACGYSAFLYLSTIAHHIGGLGFRLEFCGDIL